MDEDPAQSVDINKNAVDARSLDPGPFDILVLLWHSRLTVGVAAGVAVALAVMYLHLAVHTFAAELKVAPTTSVTDSGTSGLGGLTALASLAGVNSFTGQDGRQFALYLEGLHSREAADRLAMSPLIMQTVFANEWDVGQQVWRAPVGLLARLKRATMRVLGLPRGRWLPPDGARLQEYLRRQVQIHQSPRTPVVTIRLQHDNRDFAIAFLTELDKTVDDVIRQNKLERSNAFIKYLTSQLSEVTVVEHRQALAELLGSEERSRMLASSGAPIAAEAFGKPAASPWPNNPSGLLILIASVLSGAMLGSLAVVLRELWRRRQI